MKLFLLKYTLLSNYYLECIVQNSPKLNVNLRKLALTASLKNLNSLILEHTSRVTQKYLEK